jgi:hypothetical protein
LAIPKSSTLGHHRARLAGEEDVVGLEVAVDDAALVGDRERRAHREGDVDDLGHGHRPALDPRAQRLAVEKLQRQEGQPVDLAHVEAIGDVGVLQARGDACFLDEARRDGGVAAEGQHLEGHALVEALAARFEHRPHAPLAELADDLVVAEARAGSEAHAERAVLGVHGLHRLASSYLRSRQRTAQNVGG